MLGQVAMSSGYTLYIPPSVPTMADPVMYARMAAVTGRSS